MKELTTEGREFMEVYSNLTEADRLKVGKVIVALRDGDYATVDAILLAEGLPPTGRSSI